MGKREISRAEMEERIKADMYAQDTWKGVKKMANDVDMANDIEDYEQDPSAPAQMIQDLHDCYQARYVEGNIAKADLFKAWFEQTYKFWGNWY